MCVVMDGYSAILVGNFFAFPPFAKKYGNFDLTTNTYQLTAPWQAGLNAASQVGAFFGILANGYLVPKFGPKRVLLGSLLLVTCFIAITFLAPTVGVLLAGQFLCGITWGIFATIAPAYASEVLPLSLRPYLTSYSNMCFIFGQLIAAGVQAGLVKVDNEWSYRAAFALQWIWPAFIFPILLFMPESPWHLVRYDHCEEALKSLKRLQSKTADIDPKETLDWIVKTNKLEKEIAEDTSYFQCFRGTEARRTEIACVAFAGQQLSGAAFAYNATYLFQQIGLSTEQTYNMNVGGTALGLLGIIVSWLFVMPVVGWRRLYLVGMISLTTILFLIGFLNIGISHKPIPMLQAILTLLWTFVFQLSVGPAGWAIPAEVGSTRLRQQTVCLARNSYNIVSITANVLEPYFMNPTEWNLKGFTGFSWAALATLTTIWAWFRLPDTARRSFMDIDKMFEARLPARKFKTHEVGKEGSSP
jgi:SP family general alpha glucoside:H+ symporter-like MFS transporter